MIAMLLTAAMVVGAGPARLRPAAMVLDLKGAVEIRTAAGASQRAAVCDLIYPGERLVVPADGAATLSILGAGAQEALRPGSEAVVGPNGCTPPAAVAARKVQKKAVASTMKNLRPAPGDSRKTGVGFRSAGEEPPAVTPISGATVTADRPGLAWPPASDAKSYRVRLLSGAGRELWKAESKEPKVAFPASEAALKPGYLYRWEVLDQDFRPVASGEFTLATESERKQLDELRELVEGGDRADRLAAALGYRRLAAFADAIAVYERLVKDAPEEMAYRRALADLYNLAGRPKEARAIAEGREADGR